MSNFLPSSSSPFTPEIAGTLAAVSYLDPSDAPATQLADMSTALSNSALPTGGQWEIAWGPADLGGNLISADVQVITFAAPTAGNPDFQGSFDSLFQGKAVRYFTNLDIVPRLWVPTGDFDLDSIEQLFPGGPQCDAGCHTAVGTAKHIVRNVTYAQPTVATMLTSAVYSEGPIGAFEQEGSQQHRMLLYLYRLGVSASVIQSTFDSSWMPPPNV
jgi:hypothetical protein